jgi:hypothetical protein
MNEPDSAVIIGNFEVSLTLTDKRTIKMSGYVFNKDTPEDLNVRLDAAQDALDRQAIRCDIANKESQIANLTQGLEFHAEHFEELVAKKQNVGKLTTQEKQLIGKFDQDVRGAQAQIRSLQAAVAAGRQKINGAMAHE